MVCLLAQQQGQSRWQKGEKQRQTGALYCLTLIRGLVRGGVRPRLPTPTAFVRVVWWVRRERYNMTCLTVSQSGENMLNLLGTSLLLAPVHSSTWLVFLLWFSCCFSKPGACQPQSTVGNTPTMLMITYVIQPHFKKTPNYPFTNTSQKSQNVPNQGCPSSTLPLAPAVSNSIYTCCSPTDNKFHLSHFIIFAS